MQSKFKEYAKALKKHITLCNVSKKYTFEKMRDLLTEEKTNLEQIKACLFIEEGNEQNASKEDCEKNTEYPLPLPIYLSLDRLLQKQEEYDALLEYLYSNLIVSISSSYDHFLSSLLKMIIIDKKMVGLVDKNISLKEALKYENKEELFSFCVEEKISELMRKSHREQIKWVEQKYNIDIVNSFSEWKTIFEFFQIRNIIVHNDGIVNKIFIEELSENGISSEKYTIGKKLSISPNEMSIKIRHMIDFSIYVFSLIMRTQYHSNEDLEEIDKIINDVVFDFLCKGKYTQVSSIVNNILKKNQRHCSADIFVFTINKCIALKFNGNDSYKEVLENLDWSNSENNFRLARAVLMDELDEACRFMEMLEKDLMIRAYVEWPLFKDFIKTKEFRNKFKEIYGTDFEDTLSGLSDEKSKYLYENNIIERKDEVASGSKTNNTEPPEVLII